MNPVQPERTSEGIRPQAGGTLDPRHVLGRDALVSEMMDRLDGRVPLLINDPRRMGKTCLLDRFAYLTESPWVTVKIDYEGVTTGEAFLRRTAEQLRAHQGIAGRVIDAAKTFLDSVEIGTGPLKVNPAFQARPASDLLDTILSRIDDRLDGDERLVLALDEVPLAIENIASNEGPLAADAILQSLRRLRQRPGSRIRWIVTGSVGFHHVLRLANTTEGAINDLESVPCGPLDAEWASELATRLFIGIDATVESGAVAALVDASGGIPYLMHYLANAMRGPDRPCNADRVRDEWAAFVHDRDRSRAVTHFLTRIGGYYGDDEPLATNILDITAVQDAPIPIEVVLSRIHPEGADAHQVDESKRVIDYLIDDHYLLDGPDGLAWRYPVLREIWRVRRRLSLP